MPDIFGNCLDGRSIDERTNKPVHVDFTNSNPFARLATYVWGLDSTKRDAFKR